MLAIPMTDYSCPDCDRVYEATSQLKIHYDHRHDGSFPEYECEACDEWFHASAERKYCSVTCRREANDQTGKATASCEQCSTEFEYYPSEKKGLYCSDCVESGEWRSPPSLNSEDNPQWNGGKRELSCEICGKTVERYQSNVNDVVVCGEACRREWLSESFIGEGHPNWNGGNDEPYGTGWNAVRRRALDRDDHQCVRCGTTADDIGRNPDVHHIVPVRSFIESDDHAKTDAHFLDNVVSLCISCHRKADHDKISKQYLRSLIDSESTTALEGETLGS